MIYVSIIFNPICEANFNHTDSGVIGLIFIVFLYFKKGWIAADRNRYANDCETLAANMSFINVVNSINSVFYSIKGISNSRVHPSSPGAAALPNFFRIILFTSSGARSGNCGVHGEWGSSWVFYCGCNCFNC